MREARTRNGHGWERGQKGHGRAVCTVAWGQIMRIWVFVLSTIQRIEAWGRSWVDNDSILGFCPDGALADLLNLHQPSRQSWTGTLHHQPPTTLGSAQATLSLQEAVGKGFRTTLWPQEKNEAKPETTFLLLKCLILFFPLLT